MRRTYFFLKRNIVIFILCLVSGGLTAQKIKPETLDIDQLNIYRHKAVTMRNAGMILTLSGVGIVTTSTIIGNLPGDRDPDGTGDPAHDGISIWAIAFADMVGVSLAIAGIPLWAVGGSRKAKAEIALQKFQKAPETPIALGVGVTIRF
ncbi:MAG TPA: hypothetical protein DDW27_20380 [Bacteroidales bacterium]|nr:hypothetical protein [Bacteroidales bacterium]